MSKIAFSETELITQQDLGEEGMMICLLKVLLWLTNNLKASIMINAHQDSKNQICYQ
jgi:hypothetical protein